MEKFAAFKETRMSAVVEAQRIVRFLAEPARVGDNIKSCIARAARRVPFWSHRYVKAVWYGEVAGIDADEFEQLRAIANGDAEAHAAREEYQRLLARLARVSAALRLSDAEFHSETLHALELVVRGPRARDSAMDQGED